MREENPGVSVSNSVAAGLVAAGSAGGTESMEASGSLDSRGGTAGQQVGDDILEIDMDGLSI